MGIKIDDKRYDDMIYNRVGDSGLKLPIISLGLWYNFGGIDSYENSKNMILYSFNSGITHFDIANNYGPPPGSAEETMGKVLKNELKGYRDEIIISTKAGYGMWKGPYGDFGSKKYLLSSLDQSLKRLNLDYVDIFYHHRPDPKTPLEETTEALEQIIRQGKALYIGISNYGVDETNKIIKMLKKRNLKLLIHQPNYSLLDRWIEDKLLDLLEDNGVGTIVYQPLAQGILTGKYLKKNIPADSRAANKAAIFINPEDITEKKVSIINNLNDVAKKRGQTLAQMSISWTLRYKNISSTLIGASRISQIDENLQAIKKISFSEEELKLIDEVIGNFTK